MGIWKLQRTLLVVALLASATPLGLAADRPRIVFSRLAPARSGLFLADADGASERPLLPATTLDYNGSFSPDGKWIIFTSERAGSADIYRVHPEGTEIERLTEGPSYDDQAALSPDGRTLAFVSTRASGTANIWLLDLATHEYTNLTKNTGGNFRPSWSPDGQWIAFSSGRDTKPGRATPSWELLQSTAIYVIRPDGAGLRRLTDLGGYSGSPQWSPDGWRMICYQSTPRDVYPASFGGTGTSQIVSIDVETGALDADGGFGRQSPMALNVTSCCYAESSGCRSPHAAIWRIRIREFGSTRTSEFWRPTSRDSRRFLSSELERPNPHQL
jgi:TolB protein